MVFTKRGPYAVLAAALVLVVGLGGATYAAAQITGANIKDGTVTTADVKDHALKLRDFSDTAKAGLRGAPGTPGTEGPSDAYATREANDTYLTGTLATVVSLTPPAGHYVASFTAMMFEADWASSALASCQLALWGLASDTGHSAATIPAGDGGYASLAGQITFTTDGTAVLKVSCLGTNAGVGDVSVTAIKVGSLHTS